MKIKVKILSGGATEHAREVPVGTTYEDLLELLRINPETVIVLCNGNPVPLDEKMTADSVDILKVVSGG